MRILVLQESDWTRRGPHQQHHLFERLKQRGHEVRVIDYDIDWREAKNGPVLIRGHVKEAKGKAVGEVVIDVYRTPVLRVPFLCYLAHLLFSLIWIMKQYREFRPHVVVSFGLLNALVGAALARIMSIPFVAYSIDSLHTLIPEEIFRMLGKLVEKQIYRLSNQVLVINKHLARYVSMLAKREVKVITAGVDRSRFNEEIDGSSVRKQLSIDSSKIVFFFMGWLYTFSGLVELSQAIESAGSGDLVLYVLGKGDAFDQIHAFAESLEREAKIILKEWVPHDDVPNHLAAADFCVLPAENNLVMRDIVPIKIYEYLSCGKPVICTKLPGIFREFGLDSGVVYVDTPDEIPDLARELSRDQEKYDQLCHAALDSTSELDWMNQTRKFEKSLLGILRKTREPEF